jgi:hypothetical protein
MTTKQEFFFALRDRVKRYLGPLGGCHLVGELNEKVYMTISYMGNHYTSPVQFPGEGRQLGDFPDAESWINDRGVDGTIRINCRELARLAAPPVLQVEHIWRTAEYFLPLPAKFTLEESFARLPKLVEQGRLTQEQVQLAMDLSL